MLFDSSGHECARTPGFAPAHSRSRRLKRSLATSLLLLLFAAPALAQNALLVSGTTPPTTGDQAVAARLQALGFTVTTVDDNDVVAGDATGQDLIVVSSSVQSGRVGDTFTFTPVPLVTWEAWIFDDLDFTGPVANADYGSISGQFSVNVIGVHPLAAGLSGTVITNSAPRRLRWGVPAPGAIIAATVPGTPAQAAIFAFETGQTMQTYPAPARRVGLGLDDDNIGVLTTEGAALFDAAIAWATEPPGNQPPIVSANDGSAVVNTPAVLSATVTDDGVALPLTLAWSQISGPGTATITNPAAASTTVSFDVAGTYVLQLSANDTEFNASDTATFTVTAAPVNQPPAVVANDTTAILGTPTSVTGSVTDDGLALPLTLTWSQISGPGTAAISDPSVASTTVLFPTAGTYVLQLEADDTEFVAADTATIIVTDPSVSREALLVSSSATAAGGDSDVLARLQTLGFTVTVVDDDVVLASDATGKDLIVVSSTVSSSKVGGTFTTTPVPLVTWEAWIFDDLDFTGGSAFVDYGSISAQTTVNVDITGSHPLTAGLSGSVVVNSSPRRLRWGNPAPGAIIAATVPGNASQATNFGFEEGQLMQTLAAPARRVGLGMDDDNIDVLTPEGEALFDAAVLWAAAPLSNQPPIVAALDGAAVSGQLVTLAGSVTDDGFTSPLTITWSQLAGPGTATITDPSAASTTVSFSAAGVYTLQLEADDTEFVVTDTATFTVSAPPTNQPPTVTANDGAAVAGITAALSGSVLDDGLALPLTIGWSQISGPGTATIGNPSAASTTVTFDTVGTYVLELTANDTEFVVSDTATFTVTAAPVNQPPTVTADDGSAITGATVALNGSVSDDAVAGPLTVAWTQIAGPGTAIITDPSVASTSVSFSAAGIYVLELSANDTEFNVTATAIFTVSDPSAPQTALFVASSVPPSAGDAAIIARLETLGFTVVPADDDTVVTADATGVDLIVVSSTVSSGKVNTKFTTTAVPLVTWEAWIFDDLDMTGIGANINFGATSGDLAMDVTGSHPLAAGLSGSVTLNTAPRRLRWGVPAPGAIIAATLPGSATQATIFGFEAGQPLLSSLAPARRVGLWLDDNNVSVWTPQSEALFDAAILWASQPSGNQPPEVSANDGSASTGVSVALTGTVNDDGVALPLSTTWSQLTGPGTATIANPGAVNTTVSFDTPGTYVLQLEANDTEFTRAAAATFTVATTNAAPTVVANDGSAVAGDSVALTGSVSDDGVALPLTTTWSQISGPGTATIADANAVNTTVSFDVAGTYVLQLEANDTEFTVSDTATFTVTPLNLPPVVVANDGSGIVGASIPLTGSVSDDGVALPLTTVWSQISGPGTATIANANAVDTTVSFDVAGSYVLRLSANDTEFTVADTATFTITASNQPPVVTANDGTAETGTPASLTGSVSDDGLALPLTTTWSQISGPGTATITDPSAVNTTVTFDTDGVYVLQLEANDTEFTVSDTATFTVTVPNTAPTVTADEGSAVTFELVGLNGSATDDGLPGVLTLTWSQLSGPGTATIDDANAANTAVSFDAQGTYVLQLEANDGDLSSTATATFEVRDLPALTREILVVNGGGELGLTDSDRLIIEQLEQWNYTVFLLDDDVVTEADAFGLDLVIISATVDDTVLGGLFTNTAVPVLSWEADLFTTMGLTGPVLFTDFGIAFTDSLEIQGSHKLSAGLDGTAVVHNDNVFDPITAMLSWGQPSASAFIAANIPGQPTQAGVFGYEAGAAMVTGTAPARRVGFFFDDIGSFAWTADGVALFRAAVEWARGDVAPPRPLRIHPIGDSITRGGAGGFWSYRDTLWNQLRADGCEIDMVGTFKGPQFGMPGPGFFDRDNDGENGFTTSNMLNDLTTRLPGNVGDVVLLFLGSNDILFPGSLTGTTKENLRTIITTLRAVNPNVAILLAQPIPSAPALDPQYITMNADIAALAGEENTAQSPIFLVDLFTGYDNATLNFDDVHPNNAGEIEIATRFFNVLRPEIGDVCAP